MTTTLIRGNALALPLADGSVDLVITSPPYFGLRSYTDGGEHYAGQIGSEPTPAEFLDALIAATTEMVRVLKPGGSIFVNLGDKYAQRTSNGSAGAGAQVNHDQRMSRRRPAEFALTRDEWQPGAMREKSLMGLPWRYAIRCIDDLGLILRAEVIWSKPNGLPESVTDRVRRSHEQWFHFTREPQYYAAVDTIRESYDAKPQRRLTPAPQIGAYIGQNKQTMDGRLWDVPQAGTNPLGKLPGSVWSVPTQPLTVPADLGVDHFAAFPMEWPRRIIQGWSPTGICTQCGQGRRPVAERTPMEWRPSPTAEGRTAPGSSRKSASGTMLSPSETRLVGEQCSCPTPDAPTRPAVVLDPFGGTGTVAMVASALGRHGISVDMSADYCRLARWRTTDPGERAKAAQVEKPPAQPADMDALW